MPVTEPEEIMVGSAGGAMVPLLLRRYKDTADESARLGPNWMGEFRRPSVAGSIVIGGLVGFLGLWGRRGKGPLAKNESAANTAAAFGGASMAGGLGSWMFSQTEMAEAAGLVVGKAEGIGLKTTGGVSLKVKGTETPAPLPARGRFSVTGTGTTGDRFVVGK